MARKSTLTIVTPAPEKAPTKLAIVEQLLRRSEGASITELMTATGWQQHSVRGVIAGSLRKRGLDVQSTKVDGTRRYSIGAQ
jgi:hypothetical protein